MNSENDLDRILNRVWLDLDWKLYMNTPYTGPSREPFDRILFNRSIFNDQLDSILEEEFEKDVK